jgi:dihydroxyacetone kinase
VAEAEAAAAAVGTMGVALGACTVPAAGKPGFTLGEGGMELGLGIHGEKGVRRAPIAAADEVVDTILDTVIADMALTAGTRVALLVNGLGGTPPIELAIVARHALDRLGKRGLKVERAWAGNFMTALEMPGVSLSVLKLDDGRLARLDSAVTAPAWPGGGHVAPRKTLPAPETRPPALGETIEPAMPKMRGIAVAVAAAFEREEARLTELDSRAGDGDLGISMARGAAAIRALPDSAWANPATACAAMSNALRRAIGGSSGPFYAVALLRAARALDEPRPPAAAWARAFSAAVASVAELGGAKPGDRTMLDALRPAADALTAATDAGAGPRDAWKAAVGAAEQGTAATATMRPKLGRAAYLGDRALGAPDAGASAVLVWMQAILAAAWPG